MLVDVVFILHVSLTTKITVTLFTIISTYSPPPPRRQKNREARSTALQPIRLITKRVVLGRDCMSFKSVCRSYTPRGLLAIMCLYLIFLLSGGVHPLHPVPATIAVLPIAANTSSSIIIITLIVQSEQDIL